MNIRSQSHKIELLLKKHQLVTFDATQPRMAIECKEGVIWVTHTGERQDYMLRAGHNYTPHGNGSLIIEAIDDARVDVEEP
jgi:hypothetical protein